MRMLGRLAAAAVLTLAGTSAVPAQARRPMTLVDVANLPRALDPQLSPDGRFVSYMLQRPDWSAGRLVPHIWRQATSGGEPEQLTFGDGEALARWSPDGRMLLFLRGGQLWLLPTEGGEPRQLSHHATAVGAPAWSPDSRAVYFIASEPRTAEERERLRIKDDVEDFDHEYKQRHLWKAIVSTGAEARITDGPSTVLSFNVSRDGRRIVFERAPSPDAFDTFRAEVWLMDADGANARVLTHNDNWEDSPELSPDGSQVLFLADMNAQFESYYNTTLFVMPAAGGTPKPVLPDTYSFDRAAWTPDGKAIIAVVNLGVHNELFRIDPGDGTRETAHRRRALDPGAAGAGMGRHRAPHGQGRVSPRRCDAVRRGLDAGRRRAMRRPRASRTSTTRSIATSSCRARSGWNGRARMERRSRGCSSIRSTISPGRATRSWCNCTAARTKRTASAPGEGFCPATFPSSRRKGFAVLRPNYRGSIGYGNAFYRDIVGGYFRHMHLDVMAGVDRLIEMGIADPDRLAVTGWSAGGHLVNKLITFTDRFKAASSAPAWRTGSRCTARATRDRTARCISAGRRGRRMPDRRLSGTTRRSRTWRT